MTGIARMRTVVIDCLGPQQFDLDVTIDDMLLRPLDTCPGREVQRPSRRLGWVWRSPREPAPRAAGLAVSPAPA